MTRRDGDAEAIMGDSNHPSEVSLKGKISAAHRPLYARPRFSFLALLVLLGLGVWCFVLWRESDRVFVNGRLQMDRLPEAFRRQSEFLRRGSEQLRRQSERVSTRDVETLLQGLQDKAMTLQERGESYLQSKDWQGQLDDLRRELAARRDAATGTVREKWEEALKQAEELGRKTRESDAWKRGQELPGDFKTLLDLVQTLKSFQGEKSESKAPLTAEKEGAS
ncbi:MAG TPA: hypothetical protein PLA90_17620 [Candidatus Sumerlaeota bacterium]|nr:hypothetical protein [Candidatus Sumerlaeota bacterium]HPS03362.1 hypothetical protein [Candidatus Sumerlaeota bacterium]